MWLPYAFPAGIAQCHVISRHSIPILHAGPYPVDERKS